jgi:hypothetical protein
MILFIFVLVTFVGVIMVYLLWDPKLSLYDVDQVLKTPSEATCKRSPFRKDVYTLEDNQSMVIYEKEDVSASKTIEKVDISIKGKVAGLTLIFENGIPRRTLPGRTTSKDSRLDGILIRDEMSTLQMFLSRVRLAATQKTITEN